MAKKTISNTFTVNTVEDGESAPYYFQEWFAWSNNSTTSSATTPPVITGSWATSIPAQGSYAYLWRKSIRYVWNENTRQYSAETAQYFRMSGTNGTSISTKGSVGYQTSQQATQHGGGTSLDDITNPSDGDAYVVGLDLEENEGWLYQWTIESGSWIPLGQFKGESGKTYYTHIAWATNVNYNSSGVVTSVDDFTTDKSPNDTTHLWMGVLVNESSGVDPDDDTSYTWSYTKGVQGNAGKDAQYIYLKGTARDENSSTTTQIPPVVNVNGGTNLATSNRGLNLVTINRQTLQRVESINYDTYNSGDGITNLISKLNSLSNNVFVCLVSSDAIGWSNSLITALQGYGMGDLPYTATGRYPFLFIGYKNLGKGNGLTRMRNVGSYTDVVELSVYIANGALTIKDGDTVQAQYAPNDNPTSSQIHTTWQNGDLYMRTRQSYETTWSSWHKIVGENGDETDYKFNISKEETSSSPTDAPSNCYYETWQDAPVETTSTYPYLWMKVVKKTWNESTQSYDSGIPSYARVTGEKGDKGADAPYIELSRSTILYRANSEGYSIESQNFAITYALKVRGNTCAIANVDNISISLPSHVTVVSGTKTTSGCTINCTHSRIMSGVITITITGTYDGVTYSATGTITVDSSREGERGDQGDPGDTGPRGKIGRFFYFAGVFDQNDESKTFEVNDAQAPYFEHTVDGQKRYHVFNYDTNGTYTMAQMWAISNNWNSAPWEVMTNDFKYLITEALFGAYAKLGSWVFNGDYMFSQEASDGSTDYQNFYNSTTGQWTKNPNILLNAYDGSGHLAGGAISWGSSGDPKIVIGDSNGYSMVLSSSQDDTLGRGMSFKSGTSIKMILGIDPNSGDGGIVWNNSSNCFLNDKWHVSKAEYGQYDCYAKTVTASGEPSVELQTIKTNRQATLKMGAKVSANNEFGYINASDYLFIESELRLKIGDFIYIISIDGNGFIKGQLV